MSSRLPWQKRFTLKSVFQIAFLCSCLAANAQTIADSSPKTDSHSYNVVFIHHSSKPIELKLQEMIQSVKVHLGEMDIQLLVKQESKRVSNVNQRKRIAKHHLSSPQTLAVLWCTKGPDGYRAFFYTTTPRGLNMRKLDLTQSSGAIAETLGVVVKASVEILIDEQHPTGHPPARLKKNHQNRLPGSSSQSQDNSAFQDSGVSQEKSASQGNTLFKDNTQATGNSQAPGNSQAKDNSPLHKDIRIRIKAVQLQRLKNADTALLTVDLMYLGAFGERSPVLFNGLHGRLALNLPKNWQLFTSYTLTFPLEVTQNLVELTLVRHPIGLGGAYNLMIGRTSLRLATSFHLDYVTHTQKSDVSEFVPQDKGGRLQVSVMPQALFSFKIAGPMAISVGLGAEIFLIRLKYSTTSENGEKTTIFQSWAVYPVMLLGLTGEF